MSVLVGNGEYGLGCSDYTVRCKLYEFPKLFGRLLAIYRNVMRGRPDAELVVMDLTAGAGRYPWKGQLLDGMIVQAIGALAATDLSWTCCAIEENPRHVRSLSDTLAAIAPADGWTARQRVLLRPGDNRAQAMAFLDSLLPGPFRCGLVLSDANGIADFDLQANILCHPRAQYFDLLGHCQAVALKRWTHVQSGDRQPTDRRRLHERLLALPRRRLLIRRLVGNPQWLYYFATNAPDIGSWKGIGFLDLGTPEGLAELERATFTREELAAGAELPGAEHTRQLSLFDAPPAEEGVGRA